MSDLIVNQLMGKLQKLKKDPNVAVNTDSSLVLTNDELNFLLNNDKQIYNNIINNLNNIKGINRININYLLSIILLNLYQKNDKNVNNLEINKYLTKIQSIINDLVKRYKGKYGSFSQNFTRDTDKLETRIRQLFIELLYSMNERSVSSNFNDITTEKVIKDTAFNGGRKTRKNTKRRTNKKRSTYKRRMNKKRSTHRRRK